MARWQQLPGWGCEVGGRWISPSSRGSSSHAAVRLTGSYRCWFVKKYCSLVCVRKIMFRQEIYDRLRQATAKRTDGMQRVEYPKANKGSRSWKLEADPVIRPNRGSRSWKLEADPVIRPPTRATCKASSSSIYYNSILRWCLNSGTKV